MPDKKFSIKHSGAQLSAAKQKQLAKAVLETLDEIQKGTVTVSVAFSKSLGNLVASHARGGKTIASDKLTAVGNGIIVLAPGKKGDVISITGNTEGTAKVTINAATEGATPVTYKTSLFSDLFILTL